MATEMVKAESAPSPFQGLDRNPIVQQVTLLVGIAAAVALGVVVVMWSQTPSYGQLYAGLSDKDSGQVMDMLSKSKVPYKISPGGTIMVPASQVHDLRIKLAAQGLPKGSDTGFEMLQEQPGFGTSQFIETARYQRALEGELARSISALNNVESARVHLALPKQSAFVRNREQPTASVLVNLYSGRQLENGQVAAIVHLIASSVPNLDSQRVTVVDQKGRLLSSSDKTQEGMLNNNQFEYTRRMEADYVKRIEEIITPIIGVGGVRAQVAAELDFTVTEQTQEKFNPEQPALRSEQVAQEQNNGSGASGGIPGALSNQPAAASTVPETNAKAADKAKPGVEPTPNAAATPLNSSSRATRNYELDKVISHTRHASGSIKRLSVAVVVDDRQTIDEDGELVRTPLKPEELERLTGLVKEAVGFNAERGDSVNVINAAFNAPPPVGPMPETPIWQEGWVWDVVKQVLAGILVLFLLFGVLRPVMRGMLAKQAVISAQSASAQALSYAGSSSTGSTGQMSLAAPGQPASSNSYEGQLNAAKAITAQDPKRVAQVVKNWVANDA